MMIYLIDEHALMSRIYIFLKFYRVVNSSALHRILVDLLALTPPEHQSRTIDAKYVNISRC